MEGAATPPPEGAPLQGAPEAALDPQQQAAQLQAQALAQQQAAQARAPRGPRLSKALERVAAATRGARRGVAPTRRVSQSRRRTTTTRR